MRKPIQIEVLRFGHKNNVEGMPDSIETEVIALCDDGSIWVLMTVSNEWVSLPKIPQGPLLEDWLSNVGSVLVEHYHIRKDAIDGIEDEHRHSLIVAYSDGTTAKDAAKAVFDKIK